MRSAFLRITTRIILLMLAGCAGTPQPVLAPAANSPKVSQDAADKGIAACRAEAEAAGIDSSKSGGFSTPNVVKRTAGNAAIGGATGAATAAIFSGDPARGASVGAVSGAMWTALSEVLYGNVFSGFKTEPERPNPEYTRSMNQCLSSKAHTVRGWE